MLAPYEQAREKLYWVDMGSPVSFKLLTLLNIICKVVALSMLGMEWPQDSTKLQSFVLEGDLCTILGWTFRCLISDGIEGLPRG